MVPHVASWPIALRTQALIRRPEVAPPVVGALLAITDQVRSWQCCRQMSILSAISILRHRARRRGTNGALNLGMSKRRSWTARIAGAGIDQHSLRASAEGWFISSWAILQLPTPSPRINPATPFAPARPPWRSGVALNGCRLLQQYLQILLREQCRISEDELTADLKISPFARALTAVSRRNRGPRPAPSRRRAAPGRCPARRRSGVAAPTRRSTPISRWRRFAPHGAGAATDRAPA